MILRDDCIVIEEFTIYPSGRVFSDGIFIFANEKLANIYLQENWYDRYGEENIKINRDYDNSIVAGAYHYVEIHELGYRGNNDLSQRCFRARWNTIIKSERDLR